jgi:hypothetical protein
MSSGLDLCKSGPNIKLSDGSSPGNTMMAHLFITTILLGFASVLIKAQILNPPIVPAQFVFGDSLVDPGNNNYIATIAKSNFFPNGIDFQGGRATGRFCNGRTVVDVIGKELAPCSQPSQFSKSELCGSH